MAGENVGESRGGVELTNLDQPLFDGADATKRDLVDYLDRVSDRILPALRGRPLSVIRVHRGQEAFMQKNVPKYTPDRVKTVTLWAETSKRDVSYALCDVRVHEGGSRRQGVRRRDPRRRCDRRRGVQPTRARRHAGVVPRRLG